MDSSKAHQSTTSNLRVSSFQALPTPSDLVTDLPATPGHASVVQGGRTQLRDVFDGLDDRLLVVVGPCSVHDPSAGVEYAARLAEAAAKYEDRLLVVMRAYFEKPRTTVGWKGLINDPHLDGSHDIATGLRTARRFLLDVTELGLPCGTEFLEPISPQYIADLVSWGAIGARTSASQIHRQLASGLSMPVGFKHGTDGDLQGALDGCAAASGRQSFLGVDDHGRAALVSTAGNAETHLILRGSDTVPNYSEHHVTAANERLARAGLNPRVVIDASHGNSGKSHLRQAVVAQELAAQVAAGRTAIAGIMLESFLVGGSQPLEVSAAASTGLTFGQSVTDECLGWDVTAALLDDLARAAAHRAAHTTTARALTHTAR
ncbi:MAG TPA: 3-deoxy-7-phosphoheptulonate synthase [Nocardioidaceae bacterium]|nr:3-deoxy-7-phosphoheptulonate synthase [Nocardioidaceae bacterium]